MCSLGGGPRHASTRSRKAWRCFCFKTRFSIRVTPEPRDLAEAASFSPRSCTFFSHAAYFCKEMFFALQNCFLLICFFFSRNSSTVSRCCFSVVFTVSFRTPVEHVCDFSRPCRNFAPHCGHSILPSLQFFSWALKFASRKPHLTCFSQC